MNTSCKARIFCFSNKKKCLPETHSKSGKKYTYLEMHTWFFCLAMNTITHPDMNTITHTWSSRYEHHYPWSSRYEHHYPWSSRYEHHYPHIVILRYEHHYLHIVIQHRQRNHNLPPFLFKYSVVYYCAFQVCCLAPRG